MYLGQIPFADRYCVCISVGYTSTFLVWSHILIDLQLAHRKILFKEFWGFLIDILFNQLSNRIRWRHEGPRASLFLNMSLRCRSAVVDIEK
jgi:hypothetical protein